MKNKVPVLIVDDEKDFASGLARILKQRFSGTDFLFCISGEEAIKLLKKKRAGVMLTDLRMPGMNGIQLMEKALRIDPMLCVVLITAYGTIGDAVKSLKLGAYDFITKPVERTALYHVVEKAMERYCLMTENHRLKKMVQSLDQGLKMIGQSHAMRQLTESIAAVAATDYTVLIRGESGTGKELAAKSVHKLSKRADRPLLSVNCPAIPEQLLESELFGHVKGAFTGADRDRKGLFETADKGTILLDEIGDISPNIQAKLLRVLQEKEIRPVGSSKKKEVDVRILATTNQDLEAKIKNGTFRQDLFYRLNVLSLTLPPLKDRKEDIPMLIHHFMTITCREMGIKKMGITPEVFAYLSAKNWPGNARELLNFVRRLVVFSTGQRLTLPLVHLVEKGSGHVEKMAGNGIIPYKEAKTRVMDDFTTGYVNDILHKTKGNISKAARMSGLERVSLQKIIKRLNINIDGFRR